jgi:hypothetical protein
LIGQSIGKPAPDAPCPALVQNPLRPTGKRRHNDGFQTHRLFIERFSSPMKIASDQVIHLLHSAPSAALATQALDAPGYPFATALPFMPDAGHRPVFLASRLAEHAKNLAADARASMLITNEVQPVAQAARLTLIGDVQRIAAEPALVQRYLRYQPDAETYLALADFDFYLLAPKRARYIAGFGQMGWLDGMDWQAAPELPLAEEAALLHELAGLQKPGVRLLGLDCFGMDLERRGQRERQRFARILSMPEDIVESARRLLPAL